MQYGKESFCEVELLPSKPYVRNAEMLRIIENA
jgi:hypothetical protein